MGCPPVLRPLLTLVCSGLLAASAVSAATINETDFAGGFGSANQNFNPTYTQIGTGFDVVNGTSRANNFDFIQFNSLNAGAQTVSFTLSLITPNANAFSNAGGEIRYSTSRTTGPYTNNLSAGFFSLQSGRNVNPVVTSATLSFSLDNSFAGGDLFVNVLQTFGNRSVAYSLGVPGNLPATVPIPPAGLLLVTALGLVLLRRSRRGDLHHAWIAAT